MERSRIRFRKNKPKRVFRLDISFVSVLILVVMILSISLLVFRQNSALTSFYSQKWEYITSLSSDNPTKTEQSEVTEVTAPPSSEYTVLEGDTEETIAAAHNISLEQLYAYNPNVWSSDGSYLGEALAVGQVINIAQVEEETEAPAPEYYSVQEGDSPEQIAANYQLTLEQLYTFNPEIWNLDGSYVNELLIVGQEIRVK